MTQSIFPNNITFCISLCVLFGNCIVCLSSIYGFWLPLWYLLITSVVSSDYLCGIFWLPLWYLLITSVVSSDYLCGIFWYLCGIFWLPLWYLLITSMVSSDYLCGIFWLLLCYLLITSVVSSKSSFCFFVSYLIVYPFSLISPGIYLTHRSVFYFYFYFSEGLLL
jgi:hypothetical protein